MSENMKWKSMGKEELRQEDERIKGEVETELEGLGIEADRFYVDLRPFDTGWPVRNKELFGPFESKKEAEEWLKKMDFEAQGSLPLIGTSTYKNYWPIQATISKGAKELRHLLLPPNYSRDLAYENVKSPGAILEDSIFKDKVELASVVPTGKDGEFFSMLNEIITGEKNKQSKSIAKYYNLSPEEGLKMAQEYLVGASNSERNARSELGGWEAASNVAVAKVLVAFFTAKAKGIELPPLPEKSKNGVLMDNIDYLEKWANSVIARADTES